MTKRRVRERRRGTRGEVDHEGKKRKIKGKRRRMTTSLMRVEAPRGETRWKDEGSEGGRPPSDRERATETERMRENAK